MLIECVPNISEGRDQAVIQALAETAAGSEECALLDVHTDADHNRSVLTFAGSQHGVVRAAFAVIEKALSLLDITVHRGEHPRFGLVDVCPFIPLEGTSMQEAADAARILAEEVGEKLKIPVFLYGEAATRPERTALPAIRRSDFERLKTDIQTDKNWAPDKGPCRLHPQFGAVAVGARKPLIAYNIDLAAEDPEPARTIAARLREKSENGLPHVRALGFSLKSRNRTQASFNLLDGIATTPAEVFAAAKKIADECGTEITRSELVGLIPNDAVYKSFAQQIRLPGFSAESVLEEKLGRMFPLASYLEKIASPDGGPAGGAVSADAGALGASLFAFVAAIASPDDRERSADLKARAFRFHWLGAMDQKAYAAFAATSKQPRGEERTQARKEALKKACAVPVEVIRTAEAALRSAAEIRAKGSITADLAIAASLVRTCAESAYHTLEANLGMKTAQSFADSFREKGHSALESVRELAKKFG